MATRYNTDVLSNYSVFHILKLTDGNRSSNQKSFATAKSNVFTTNSFENYDIKAPDPLYSLIFLMPFSSHSYAICVSFVCTRMLLVCHSYVTHMYSCVIRMSHLCARILSICTRMSFACHSYVLVCYLYVTRKYSYVMACHSHVLVCDGISLVCTRISSVCYLNVLACHPCVTGMYWYVIRMSPVCDFTMNWLNNVFDLIIINLFCNLDFLSVLCFVMNFNNFHSKTLVSFKNVMFIQKSIFIQKLFSSYIKI